MKLGICLSGGGVKGAAHIGVLKACQEEGIEFEYISGTSSGSIVATLYAVGYQPDEIYDLFKKYCKQIKYVDWKNIVKGMGGLLLKRKIIIDGLNSGSKINKIITQACQKKNIQNINQIKKNLLIPCVDLYNGTVYVFSSKSSRKAYSNKMEYIYDMPIGDAVQASCSYPGVFSPCSYHNTKLIDGGIRENVPWKETKIMGAEKVISVIFEKDIQCNTNENIINVVANSLDILSHELSTYELAGADYLLEIKTKNIQLLDVSKIDQLYEEGYKVAKGKMNEILKL